ncbi:MAG: DUF4253 domain-containing protein [Actinomycetia bacterium]|nr:DUF4253 domain-containing protein [Actinomycetes bacterium]
MPQRIRVLASPGSLPGAGPCTLGPVELPAGRPVGRLWLTNDLVPGSGDVWLALAGCFESTGLWPLVVSEPLTSEHFPYLLEDPALNDPASVLAVPLGAPELDTTNPVVYLAETPWLPGDGQIALVPVIEPADVVARTGWGGATASALSTGQLSAVLRSWQRRYGTLPLAIGASTLFLACAASPSDAETVLGEHQAFCRLNTAEGLPPEQYLDFLRTSAVWPFAWA